MARRPLASSAISMARTCGERGRLRGEGRRRHKMRGDLRVADGLPGWPAPAVATGSPRADSMRGEGGSWRKERERESQMQSGPLDRPIRRSKFAGRLDLRKWG